MMRRFCDRCDREIDHDASPNVSIVPESDRDGNGTVTDNWDLCTQCASLLDLFMKGGKLQGEGQ